MFYPDKKKFLDLSKKGNLIPVYCDYFSDLETPVSTFLKIAKSQYSFILESVEAGRHIGRYSFLADDPCLVFSSKGRKIKKEVRNKDFFGSSKIKDEEFDLTPGQDPLDEIKKMLSDFKPVIDKKLNLPRFFGGFVGYIGYEMVEFFEPVSSTGIDDLNLPDSIMVLTDTLVVFDHLTKRLKLICNIYIPENEKNIEKLYKNAVEKLKKLIKKINIVKEKNMHLFFNTYNPSKVEKKIKSNIHKNDFIKKVKQIKKNIKEGEIIQAVFSQRLSYPFEKHPMILYRALRAINPSPYMFFLKYSDMYIIGSSPEVMVRCENSSVELRPIAGTRPRGKDEEEDLKLGKELIEDKKERAEHVMLVDLGRNDLGRVCNFRTVKVPEFMIIEKYSHVLHLVSSVTGELREDKDIFDLFKACFPAGTVTGAPKVRAMQIIDRMEKNKRGPYAGSIGYFSFSGNMDTCITIRTIIAKHGIAYIQAGAGIVADSVPEKEYEETLNKAKALIKAVQIADQAADYKLQDTG